MSPFLLALSLSFIWAVCVGIAMAHTVAMGGRLLTLSSKLLINVFGFALSVIPLAVIPDYPLQILIASAVGYIIGLFLDLVIHVHHDTHLA